MSKTLLVALKIAVMDPCLHEPLAERLAAVPVTQSVTCRLWLRQALFDLDNEGYIKLTRTVDEVLTEGSSIADLNQRRRRRRVKPSEGSDA